MSYTVVTSGQMETIPAENNFELTPAFLASKEIYELELEAVEVLRGINQHNRELGNFLHNLNRRIALLGRTLMAGELEDEVVSTNATLSEGGISFLNDELIAPETRLALKMVFTPSFLGISCYARVIHCRLTDDAENYRVGTQFMRMDEASRHLIARHIIRQQSIERRERLRRSFHDSFT